MTVSVNPVKIYSLTWGIKPNLYSKLQPSSEVWGGNNEPRLNIFHHQTAYILHTAVHGVDENANEWHCVYCSGNYACIIWTVQGFGQGAHL